MYEEKFIDVNNVRLHVIFAGPQDGKPIILLHGFPEFWYSWRHQIEPLAAAGYRVIVPDQRGYNTSSKPIGVKHYHINQLTADITGLIDSLGYEQVTIVGHDWGGVVVWQLISDYPKRFLKAVILNAPHLGALKRSIIRNPIQFVKSWQKLSSGPWPAGLWELVILAALQFKKWSIMKKSGHYLVLYQVFSIGIAQLSGNS